VGVAVKAHVLRYDGENGAGAKLIFIVQADGNAALVEVVGSAERHERADIHMLLAQRKRVYGQREHVIGREDSLERGEGIEPWRLLMSNGQGRPSTVVFFISYWKDSERRNLCGINGASNETPGMASARPTMPPFLPRTEGTIPLTLKLHWSSGGRVSMVVSPPEKTAQAGIIGGLVNSK